MPSHPHPTVVLSRLLHGQPFPRSLDPYPTHWRTLLQSLAAVPAHPQLRQQALPMLLARLPDSVLAEITANIENPDTFLRYVPLTPKQHQVISALSEIGPAIATEIARYLDQDSSNVHKRLLTLVSLGQLERFDSSGSVCYRLPGLR